MALTAFNYYAYPYPAQQQILSMPLDSKIQKLTLFDTRNILKVFIFVVQALSKRKICLKPVGTERHKSKKC